MKTKSFTLIELLVVIVIIGILAGVIIVSTSSSIGKANIAKVKVFENSVLNELGANMVSRWKLDEIVSTTTTPDAWGNNTGTLGDGVTASTYPTLKGESECVTGKCMYFDGLDDYIDCGNGTILNVQDITLSIWIYPEAVGGLRHYRIMSKNSTAGYMINMYSNTLETYIGTQKVIIKSPMVANNWYFVTVTAKNNENIKTYVNGLATNTATFTGTIVGGASNVFQIGENVTSFNGLMDDARIYNFALSTSQIKQEYIAGLNSLLANGNISKEEYNERIKNIGSNF